jgi:hypothetical protein
MATMKAKALTAAAFAATAGLAAAPASAATHAPAATTTGKPHGFVPKTAVVPKIVAAPDTAQGCTYGTEVPLAEVCGMLSGYYQMTTAWSITGCIESATVTAHLEIASPNNDAWLNTTSATFKPGECYSVTSVFSSKKFPAGKWKFRFWRKYDGKFYNLAQHEIDVVASP